MSVYALKVDALGKLDDDRFFQLCQDNPNLKFERSATGELIVMTPTGGETGRINIEIAAEFVIWNRRTELGFCFDSSTGFKLPNGAERSPDIAWIEKSRWLALSPNQREKFPPIAPDFVLELLSPSDNLEPIRAKMREYIDNGVRLAWLLDRQHQRAEVYRPGQAVEQLDLPTTLTGDDVLPGFALKVSFD